MLTEGHGVPLSLCVTGANRHDSTQLEIVLDGIVVPRPEPDEDEPQNLCVDARLSRKLNPGRIFR